MRTGLAGKVTPGPDVAALDAAELSYVRLVRRPARVFRRPLGVGSERRFGRIALRVTVFRRHLLRHRLTWARLLRLIDRASSPLGAACVPQASTNVERRGSPE